MEEQTEYPICIKCKHCILNPEHTDLKKKVSFAYCAKSERIDLVSGETKYLFCEVSRASPSEEACGKEGRLFEAGEPH